MREPQEYIAQEKTKRTTQSSSLCARDENNLYDAQKAMCENCKINPHTPLTHFRRLTEEKTLLTANAKGGKTFCGHQNENNDGETDAEATQLNSTRMQISKLIMLKLYDKERKREWAERKE